MSEHQHKNQRDVLLQTILEQNVGRMLSPLEHFIHKQTTAALLLSIATVVALIFANLPWFNPIDYISEIELGFLFQGGHLTMPIGEWINSGLMAFFFFLIGLEIKRSIIAGKLHNLRHVTLIILAAIGGMVFPSIVYLMINSGGDNAQGWAIPMATDTAFAVGVLAVLAKRISASISIFLAALAIFDDIGAILVIATFYTQQLHYTPLLLSLIPFALLVCSNRMGITNGWVFVILGVILWYFIHESGIHGTLAGLLVALTIPSKTYLSQRDFIDRGRHILGKFACSNDKNNTMLSSESQHHLAEEMHSTMKVASTPLQRWEQLFINPIGIIILPLFALFNAGIELSGVAVMNAFESSVTWGIIAGLVIGKPLGIILFSYIGMKLKIGSLPDGVSFKDVIGVGMIAGIGFTMSVFIADLSFASNPELIELAKFGIIAASLLSATLGIGWFFFSTPNQRYRWVKFGRIKWVSFKCGLTSMSVHTSP
ncbi:MAG: Na+/H+ antiporter NhaA [Rickettsiales bacterium]|nr:Na+/H+ antiporter NhaA [Pseudomonadota bacterium]MDA0967210.1 Na+/H+ antiporter NhaA [Pseudomonadota bacterium]MDG4544129.1 Na+/H+ antiporter NhaA [Rickettsiales bacterium]MDG4546310.1 Na+/H+ antiporter NhaA [Rickettsiales bacterium]MDG4548453.1 Na+/H+ antiporter NhaA [Rickettsiales bacterium]